jgi:stearoyl-CoA 9-desaturase NADPH oxidoreductase
MAQILAPLAGSARRRVLAAARGLTTPLVPDDYLAYVKPLWCTREPRGRVEAVAPETADSVTVWIRPPLDWVAHRPGQYVRVGVDVDGVRHWRTYSLTSIPGERRIAITVKAVAGGVVSTQLVRHTKAGTIVRLTPPAGDYVLPEPAPARLLFVTAGSGITPVMGMLRALAAQGTLRDVTLVHIAPRPCEVIFGAELRGLARRGELRLHEHHDVTDGRFEAGRLDGLCRDWRERSAWACGPAGLLDSLARHWDVYGDGAQLHVERFRPVVAADGAAGAGGRVRFSRSGREVEADGSTPLLVAGESAGALLPSGCRMGICQTCVGRLRSGAVRDLRTGALHSDEGELVRTCVSAAAGPVEIEL